MRAWMLPAGSDGFDKLYLEELPDPTPGPGEVLIQMLAWSINYRDFAVASGHYFGGVLKQPAIPLSDAAGVVAAVGPGVTRFKEGDRVQSAFFTHWEDGAPKRSMALGDGNGPGRARRAGRAAGKRRGADGGSLDHAQAACLPCARAAEHLRGLADGIAAAPAAALSLLPLLSGAERQQLLLEWNDTRSPLPAARGSHGLFEAQARRTPALSR